MLTASPHGLFGLETPEAIRRYRLEYGYGAAQRVYVLAEEERQFQAGDANADAVERLAPERRRDYEAALGGAAGCEEAATSATGGPAALSDSEPLAVDYARALDAYRRDPVVRRAEAQVLQCLQDRGHDFASHDAITEHYLTALGELVHGVVERDEQGRLVVVFGATEEGAPPVRVSTAALDALAEAEADVAKDEVACRDERRGELGQALASHARELLEEHAATIRWAAEAYRASARGGPR